MKHHSFNRRTSKGFTLIELLVVILIISVLASLLFAVGPSIINNARKVQASSAISQIEVAINSYYTDYSRLPNPDDSTEDTTMRSDEKIMNILMAVDGTGNTTHEKNPRRTVYLEPPGAKGGKAGIETTGADQGKFKDPWGEMYYIRLDFNYDDQIDGEESMPRPAGVDTGTALRPKRIAVWSSGKDKQVGTAFSKDDVYTY
jgi:prepilin-type N-terminal cleavage/methylation domain-containing protein